MIKWRCIKTLMKLLSTREAADRLGISKVRVTILIKEGRLPAERVGERFIIRESDLKLVADRKSGRPPKQATKQKVEKKSKVKG